MNNDNATAIVEEQVKQFLGGACCIGDISANEIACAMMGNTVYWEKQLSDGLKLVLLRLRIPLVQREEVFLGNVLFNSFMSKTLLRVASKGNNKAALIANDLENYFYLAITGSAPDELIEDLQRELLAGLPALFFGAEDQERGVYGNIDRMFTFIKSEFEPFPVYAVPQFLDRALSSAVQDELGMLLSSGAFDARLRTALATIAFFYGQRSGGDGDAQSFPVFLMNLIQKYGVIDRQAVARALNLQEVDKKQIKDRIATGGFSTELFRELLVSLLAHFDEETRKGNGEWFLGYIRHSGKLIDVGEAEYIGSLLAGSQLGYVTFSPPVDTGGSVECRLCGGLVAELKDRYIVTGPTSFKFHNQMVRGDSNKICVKCALFSYLGQKLLGTSMASLGGKLPQIPKNYNLIFHYGKHDPTEVSKLAKQLDLIYDLILSRRQTEKVLRDLQEQEKQLADRLDRERSVEKRRSLEGDLQSTRKDHREAEGRVQDIDRKLLRVCPFLDDPVPSSTASLDVLANMMAPGTLVERHVLGLGSGGYRMILFVLPRLRPPRDADYDFAQKRFSNSRIVISSLLAFLREVCGCDGPFYYQSLPALTPDAFAADTFYIHNRAITTAQAKREYEMVTDLAWRVVKKKGGEGFVEKVLLAEELLDRPLATFSAILRNSPILRNESGKYKLLGGAKYRADWKAQDLSEYAEFFGKLCALEEVK